MASSPEGLLTIQDFIRWGASRFNADGLFFGHGTDNALDEATQLVLHALHLPPDLPATYRECRLTFPERGATCELLERRITERKPAAYLTNRAWFAGLEFYVNEDVLVPRSPLAELVEAGFDPWVGTEGLHRVLDLGAGSGCIGIACAVYLPEVEVDLAEVSPAALEVASVNRARHHLEERVQLLQSDLFEHIGDRRYDIIVSNPPYVSAAELATLPEESRKEPSWGWRVAKPAWIWSCAFCVMPRPTSTKMVCWWSRSETPPRSWSDASRTCRFSGSSSSGEAKAYS